MRPLAFLATLLAATAAFAAPAKAPQATLELTGPDTAAISEEVELIITGVTLDELTKAIEEEQFDLTLWPIDGTDLDPTYNWMTRQIELELTCTKPGKYVVKLHLVRGGKLEVAKHELTVGETPPPPPPPPVNPHPAPSPEWRRVVEPMIGLELPPTDATRIAEWYSQVAQTVRTDDALRTTGDLRKLLVATGKQLDLQGKYPKLAAMHDVILANELTLIIRPLARDKAGDLLDGMAWATWEAGHK